ncbi:piggyBac transposable element-derived protein 4-like [Pimephales promelas]|nr:piggyBac transposable element-derived protein 4-like [Pimephales promelas]
MSRCVFGCGPHGTLFPFPKTPWLRSRWLGFLHCEEGGITERSRMCSKHFTRECFKNWTEHEMGFVRYLSLTDNAVPSVYTVGTSQSLTPITRDVACQSHTPPVKNVSAQTKTHKQKRRSKAVQVKPLVHSVGVCVGTGAPCLTSTPMKRPRTEDSVR